MKKPGIIILAALLAAACTSETYESGDGKHSYLTTGFVELHTAAAKVVTLAVTDHDDTLHFAPSLACEWAVKADTAYRALLYYNVGNGAQAVEPVSATMIPVLRWRMTSDMADVVTDPVVFQSAWISLNGSYLNIGLGLKSGTDASLPEDTKQSLGMMCDTVMTRDDGTRLYQLRLFHAQNGIPEYYTNRLYVSVPLRELRNGDEIQLTINTYGGTVVRILPFCR